MAQAASTTGTALGTMHVSCLPSISSTASSIFFMSMVSWAFVIEGTGFKATRNNRHSVGNSPVYAAVIVGFGPDLLPVHIEAVVSFTAPHSCYGKASAELHTLNRGYGKQDGRKFALNIAEVWSADSGRKADDGRFKYAPHRIQIPWARQSAGNTIRHRKRHFRKLHASNFRCSGNVGHIESYVGNITNI